MSKYFSPLKYFKSSEYKKIFGNIANFSFFQLTNYLVPLVTIPYIVRTIGIQNYGIISIVMAVIYTLGVVVDYGFDISGIRRVAQNRDSINQTRKIFSAIISIKFLLMILIALSLYLVSYIFEEVRRYSLVYIFAFGTIPGQIMTCSWLFTGKEDVKYLNMVNFVSRTLYLAGIFIFVQNQNDFAMVPLLNSGSILVAGILSIILIKKYYNIVYTFPGYFEIKDNFKRGWYVFVTNFFINLYRSLNVIILGFFATKEIVGYYSAGEKLIKLIQSIFTPITKSLYPYISRKMVDRPDKVRQSIKFLVKFAGGITLFISFVVFLFADQIVLLLYGNGFQRTIFVIQASSIVIFAGTINYILGIIYMLNFDLEKQLTVSVIITGISNIIVCTIGSYYFFEIGATMAFAFAEMLLLSLIILFIIVKSNSRARHA